MRLFSQPVTNNFFSSQQICPYPPGVPLIVRGERILNRHLEIFANIREAYKDLRDDKNAKGLEVSNDCSPLFASGCFLTGCDDHTLQTLRVYKL